MSLLQLGGSKSDKPAGPPRSAPGGSITLTEKAHRHIQTLLQQEGGMLRVAAREGGCSGWNYEIELAEAPTAEDRTLDFGSGVEVVMDPQSIELLRGLQIDYKVSFQETGFVFVNPNAKRTCGCGISFEVER